MGIGLIDIDAKDCMMLKAHQSLSNKELSLRNKTMVDFYIGVIKRYRKELLKLSTLIVADAYFSTSTFVNGIKKEGFSLISRFRDNACLFYVYAGPRTRKRGRPKTKDGKIDMKNLDLTRMEKMEMKDIEGTKLFQGFEPSSNLRSYQMRSQYLSLLQGCKVQQCHEDHQPH